MTHNATICLNPAIDTHTDIDRVVADRKLRCSRAVHQPGGGGVNVSRALDRLGESSLALYLYGGATGRMYRHLLDRACLNHRGVETRSWTRENVMVRETDRERQYRFVMPGPNVREAEWETFCETVGALDPFPDLLVASGSLPPGVPDDALARLARLARQRGAKYIVDSSGVPLRKAVREGVYLLKPNDRELAALTERAVDTREAQGEVASDIVRSGRAEAVVVSRGAKGALLVTREGETAFEPPEVHVESTVGSGDSAIAGLVTGLARGWPLERSVRLGLAAGAAAVTTPATELCPRETVEELFERTDW